MKLLKTQQGKPEMAFLPWREIEEVAKVENHGAKKYARYNWQKAKPEDYLNAALRHISARLQGHFTDDRGKNPSGRPHLAHAICDLLFVMGIDRKNRKKMKKKAKQKRKRLI